MGRPKQFFLHAQPGVYVFYAADGTCLYVGSSINMKQRVGTNKHRKLAHRVEYHPCVVEKLCELEDSKVYELKPTLNIATRISRPGQAGKHRVRDEQLRLVSGSSYWTWEVNYLRFPFRSIVDALNAYPLIRAAVTPEAIALGKACEDSMYNTPMVY